MIERLRDEHPVGRVQELAQEDLEEFYRARRMGGKEGGREGGRE